MDVKEALQSFWSTIFEFTLWRTAEGWRLEKHELTDETEERTVRFEGKERTLNVPVWRSVVVFEGQGLVEEAERLQGEYEERYGNHSYPTLQREAVWQSEWEFEDFVVPDNYERSEEDRGKTATCSNCKGERIFRNISCACTAWEQDSLPNPDCKGCGGTGKHNPVCPICKGEGVLPAVFVVRFVNEETGEMIALRLGPNPMLPVELVHNYYDEPEMDFEEWRAIVRLNWVFEEVCARLGVSSDTHFFYNQNKPAVWWGQSFSGDLLGIWRKGDLLETGISGIYEEIEGELAEKYVQSLSRTFSTRLNDEFFKNREGDPMTWHFRPRRSTEELLEDLHNKLRVRGYGFALTRREGNIATGEAGWQVFLTDDNATRRYAELAVEYDVDIALESAWNKTTGDLLDKVDRWRQENE